MRVDIFFVGEGPSASDEVRRVAEGHWGGVDAPPPIVVGDQECVSREGVAPPSHSAAIAGFLLGCGQEVRTIRVTGDDPADPMEGGNVVLAEYWCRK